MVLSALVASKTLGQHDHVTCQGMRLRMHEFLLNLQGRKATSVRSRGPRGWDLHKI